ncbi:hypothetical protein [Bacillus sp. 165]|uniref:hypothetical protein n=1 Tax=Bacillus sp. 165 TaxID=1529117 RepID=UPI001ADCBC66|nr:hypothetical protein [Bacillus sp. 165]MBO9129309.1 hypothetical protein [Bacillus sp. 165]
MESILIDSIDTVIMFTLLYIFITAKISFQLYSELPCVYEQSQQRHIHSVPTSSQQATISQYTFNIRRYLLRLIKLREGPGDDEEASLFLS